MANLNIYVHIYKYYIYIYIYIYLYIYIIYIYNIYIYIYKLVGLDKIAIKIIKMAAYIIEKDLTSTINNVLLKNYFSMVRPANLSQ